MHRCFASIFLSIALAVNSLQAQSLPSAHPSTQTPVTTPQMAGEASTPETKTRAQENWATIKLADSGLRLGATGGVLLSKVDVPGGCTRELLHMQWRPNDPVDLYVIRPRGSQLLPVVLFLYNYTYDTDVFRADRWCARARENGFAVVGFASALSWSRLHTPRPMKQWFVSQLQEALASSTHDVEMILNYLQTRGDLDMEHFGMFGQGSGGAVAILAAAADPRIRALDLMDPWGDWPAWLKSSKQIPEEERSTYLEAQFLEQVSGLDPVTYLPLLQGRALRIEQVMNDPVTPPEARERIAASVPEANEVNRYANQAAEAKALGTNGIVGWFKEQVVVGMKTPDSSLTHGDR